MYARVIIVMYEVHCFQDISFDKLDVVELVCDQGNVDYVLLVVMQAMVHAGINCLINHHELYALVGAMDFRSENHFDMHEHKIVEFPNFLQLSQLLLLSNVSL